MKTIEEIMEGFDEIEKAFGFIIMNDRSNEFAELGLNFSKGTRLCVLEAIAILSAKLADKETG